MEASRSLREVLSEFSGRSESFKSVRLTNRVTYASIEVANQFTHVQDSTVESGTRGGQDGLLPNPSFTLAAMPTGLQNSLRQFVLTTGSRTGFPSDAATGISTPDSTPFFVFVPYLNNSNQPLKKCPILR